MDDWLLTPDNLLRKKLPDISQIDSNKKSRAALIHRQPDSLILERPGGFPSPPHGGFGSCLWLHNKHTNSQISNDIYKIC